MSTLPIRDLNDRARDIFRQIVEVIAVVALNVFTNILGKAVRVDIDFPKVALLHTPAKAAA